MQHIDTLMDGMRRCRFSLQAPILHVSEEMNCNRRLVFESKEFVQSPINYWIKAEQRQSILQPKQNSFFFFPSVRNWIQTEHGQLVLQLAEVSITLKQQLNTQCQQTVSAAPREACYYFHFEIECKLSTDNQSYSQQIEHRQSVPQQGKSHHWRLEFVIKCQWGNALQ